MLYVGLSLSCVLVKTPGRSVDVNFGFSNHRLNTQKPRELGSVQRLMVPDSAQTGTYYSTLIEISESLAVLLRLARSGSHRREQSRPASSTVRCKGRSGCGHLRVEGQELSLSCASI